MAKRARKTPEFPITVSRPPSPKRPWRNPVPVVHERLKEISALMKAGADDMQLQSVLAPKWGVSRRTVRRYSLAVRKHWLALDAGRDDSADRAELRQQLQDTYVAARAAKDYRACTNILRTKAAILVPRRLEVAGPGGGAIQHQHGVDEAQFSAMLEAIKELPDGDLNELTRISGFLSGRDPGEGAGQPTALGEAPGGGGGGEGAPER